MNKENRTFLWGLLLVTIGFFSINRSLWQTIQTGTWQEILQYFMSILLIVLGTLKIEKTIL